MNGNLADSTLSKRDASRTQLFGSNEGSDVRYSPYDKRSKIDYSQATLAQLESQSDEQMGTMKEKLVALKQLSFKLGDEIRGSNHTIDELGNTFQGTTVKLKKTFGSMMEMAKRSRITVKTWLAVFFVVFLLFFWVWIT